MIITTEKDIEKSYLLHEHGTRFALFTQIPFLCHVINLAQYLFYISGMAQTWPYFSKEFHHIMSVNTNTIVTHSVQDVLMSCYMYYALENFMMSVKYKKHIIGNFKLNLQFISCICMSPLKFLLSSPNFPYTPTLMLKRENSFWNKVFCV